MEESKESPPAKIHLSIFSDCTQPSKGLSEEQKSRLDQSIISDSTSANSSKATPQRREGKARFDTPTKNKDKRLTSELAVPEYRKTVEEYECPLCLTIPDKMTQCSECEQIFCEACIEPLLQMPNASCPTCRGDLEVCPVSRKLRNILNNSMFNCAFGCAAIFNYESRENHYSECTKESTVGNL